jgi:hypothetical protein
VKNASALLLEERDDTHCAWSDIFWKAASCNIFVSAYGSAL